MGDPPCRVRKEDEELLLVVPMMLDDEILYIPLVMYGIHRYSNGGRDKQQRHGFRFCAKTVISESYISEEGISTNPKKRKISLTAVTSFLLECTYS